MATVYAIDRTAMATCVCEALANITVATALRAPLDSGGSVSARGGTGSARGGSVSASGGGGPEGHGGGPQSDGGDRADSDGLRRLRGPDA